MKMSLIRMKISGRAGETHFHMNGFARRLVLTQRQKVTRKWPIGPSGHSCMIANLICKVSK